MRSGHYVSSVLLFAAAVGAHADTMTPVSGSGGTFSGSGTLYVSTTPSAQGGYLISGITADGVTTLLDPGTLGTNDNLLFLGKSPLLDGQGFAFTDVMDGTEYQVDLYYSSKLGSYAVDVLDPDGDSTTLDGTFSIDGSGAATPMARRNSFASVLAMNLAASPATQAVSFSFAATAPEPVAVTPEPASFALLGTGFLGVAGLLRRRSRS